MAELRKNWGKADDKVPFGDRLSALCAREMCVARLNPDRAAAMLERLTNSLAFTIAMLGRGEAKATSNLIEGVTTHLYERTTGNQRIASILEKGQ